MKKIHKYPLLPPFIVHAPRDAQWLHVASQNVEGRTVPVIWAIVDDSAFNVKHTFSCLGTGQEVGEHVDRHIGTILMEGGQYVIHVFLDKVGDGNA